MKDRNISRRQFLTWAGSALGASVLACGGLGVWASQWPEIEFAESSCAKEKKVSKKTLIAYDSRTNPLTFWHCNR